MHRVLNLACLASILLSSISAVAQDPPVAAEPSPEHLWLKKFEGKWKTSGKTSDEDPNAPVMAGTIESELIGKFWAVNKMTVKFGDFEMQGRQTLGYDKEKEAYVGTWIDSSSDFIWRYEGTVDKGGKLLTLQAEGPDMAQPGKMALYRDCYEFVSPDEMKLISSVKGPDGKWVDFMVGTAKRVK